MKRLSGFSLMEMMTVLLIVSIVAAATAPMINKKMMASRNVEAGAGAGAGGGCHWQDIGNGNIAYNQDGSKKSVVIGSNRVVTTSPLLYLEDSSVKEYTRPQISFVTYNSDYVSGNDHPDNMWTQANLYYQNGTMGFSSGTTINSPKHSVILGKESNSGSNAVSIGYSSAAAANAITIGPESRAAQNSIAIGEKANEHKTGEGVVSRYSSTANNSIAIGHDSSTTGTRALAIGKSSTSSANDAMAIGSNALAEAEGAIAIGSYYSLYHNGSGAARASGNQAIAIGRGAISPADNSISIGEARARGVRSIAIGPGAGVGAVAGPDEGSDNNAQRAIAIGSGARASANNSVAIGVGAKASANNAVAIGSGAEATLEKQIVLGTADSTVYIPGNLVVGGEAILGLNGGVTWLRAHKHGDTTDKLVKVRYDGDNLEVSGATYSSTDYPLSDRRLKNVGKAFTGGLAELKKLDLFHFTYKKDKSNTPHVGVMAQDLQKVFPDAVTKGDDGFLRIRMEDMFYALVNAVKELAGMFDKQDERIVQLEKENKQLQKTISDLEKRLAKLEKQK